MFINPLSASSLFQPIVTAIDKYDRLKIAISCLACTLLLGIAIYWTCSLFWRRRNVQKVQPKPPEPSPKPTPKPLSQPSPKKNNEALHPPLPPFSPSILQTPAREENIQEGISRSPNAKKNLLPLFEHQNPEKSK